MTYRINHLSLEEIKILEVKFPGTVIGEYEIMDGKIILSRHNNENEAKTELKRWAGRDAIQDKIEEMLDELIQIGEKYDLAPDEIRHMIKDS